MGRKALYAESHGGREWGRHKLERVGRCETVTHKSLQAPNVLRISSTKSSSHLIQPGALPVAPWPPGPSAAIRDYKIKIRTTGQSYFGVTAHSPRQARPTHRFRGIPKVVPALERSAQPPAREEQLPDLDGVEDDGALRGQLDEPLVGDHEEEGHDEVDDQRDEVREPEADAFLGVCGGRSC